MVDIGPRFISDGSLNDQAISEYLYRFKTLLDELDTDYRPGHEYRRSYIIERFNELACGLATEADYEAHPLASIAYREPKRPLDRYANEVARSLVTYPWFQTFGVTYEAAMAMPRDEFKVLEDLLIEESKKEDPDTLFKTVCINRLTDLVSATISGKILPDKPE